MASSSLSRNWRYGVFVSSYGPNVRKTFLSHLRKQFSYNGITMFNDQEIKSGQNLTPEILQAIRGSRISIVVFSTNYASSSWCLEELVEILKCREEMGQIVMTVYYGADSSEVRRQTGEFGRRFDQTCSRKTEEERLRWSQALSNAANIVGEDFGNCDNEADLIEKVSRDVSDKLNAATISRDFEDKVGIDAHLQKMLSLLHLDTEYGAMIVGISGPVGIGKTTIARALHSQLSSRFHLTCFMENLKGSYISGLDEYGFKLRLQEQLLSKILNQNGMRIYHLGAIEERLSDLKVDDLKQLEALANQTTWFGPGSRIIVTTQDQELLRQHGIDSTYPVDLPTSEEALEIFCRYAFRQNYPDNGFKELAERVVYLCDNLPLSLSMVGSSLRGKKEEVWEKVMRKLETTIDHRDIEQVLRAVYEQS